MMAVSTDTALPNMSVYDTPVNIVGLINADNAVSYRLILNDTIINDWAEFEPAPMSVNIQIPVFYFNLGSNELRFEYKNELGEEGSWESIVIRKPIDSFYISESQCFNFPDKLLAGGAYISFLKTEVVHHNVGYLKSATVTLKLKNGNGSRGTIKVAPILSNWSSKDVTLSNLPYIDINKAISKEITYIDGLVSIDVTEFVKSLSDITIYGVAVFSDLLLVELDFFDSSFIVEHQTTELILPDTVFGNRVTLHWKPLILEKPEAFKKLILKRSTSPSFAGAEILFETSNPSILKYEDKTISKGTYYYRLEVHFVDNAYQGDQLDFDFEDRHLFVEQDPIDGTVFEDGVVKISFLPEKIAYIDCEDNTNFIYNTTKVEIRDGVVKLLGKK